MNNTINLLPRRNQGENKNAKSIKILQVCAAIALVILVISSVSLFLLTQFASKSLLPGLNSSQPVTIPVSDNAKAAKILIIKKRLQDIQAILKSRLSYDVFLINIKNDAPTDVAFSAIDIEQNTADITATSANLQSLDNFLQSLQQMVSGKQLIKSFILDSIGINQGQPGYTMTVKAQLL